MISIIVPTIRPDGLRRLAATISGSLCEPYNLIAIGPNENEVPPTPLMNSFTNIIDRGSPSRCLQRAVSVVVDDIFTWGTDDGVYLPDKLVECVKLLRSKTSRDGIVVKYTEGGTCPFNGSLDEYYVAKNHDSNIQPGINPEWKTAPVGMFYTSYFKHMGGIDCRFEHMNMNIHDFCYRLQRDGGELYFSPGVVLDCDSDNSQPIHRPLDTAHHSNDMPLFRYLYRNSERELKIDFNNWKNSSEVWRRFT